VVKNFSVCDFSRLAVTEWRLRRWRLWFLALMTATHADTYVKGCEMLNWGGTQPNTLLKGGI